MSKTKRIVAVVLAMISVLLLCAPAFAASDNTAPKVSDVRIDTNDLGYSSKESAVGLPAGVGTTMRVSAKVLDDSEIESVIVTINHGWSKSSLSADGDITDPWRKREERTLSLEYDQDTNRWYCDYIFNKYDMSGNYWFYDITAKDIHGNSTYMDENDFNVDWIEFYNKYTDEEPEYFAFENKSWESINPEATRTLVKGDKIHFKPVIGYYDDCDANVKAVKVIIYDENFDEFDEIDLTKSEEDFRIDGIGADGYGYGSYSYWIGEYQVDQYMRNGRYYFALLAVDTYGNRAWITHPYITETMWTAEDAYVDVINQPVDKEAPVLVNGSLKFSAEDKQVTYGDQVTVSFKLKDENEIVTARPTFAFNEYPDPDEWKFKYEGDFYKDAVYDKRTGTYKASFIIDNSFVETKYQFTFITVEDSEGNKAAIPVNMTFYVVGDIILTENIELSQDKIEQVFADGESVEGTVNLSYTVSPVNVSMPIYKWVSTNEKVATVDEDGLVTFVGYGECEILVKAMDGSNVTASCKVSLKRQYVEGMQIKIGKKVVDSEYIYSINTKTVKNGKAKAVKLTVKILPENANNRKYTWKSTNEDVVKVYQTKQGWFAQPMGVGEAQIICTAKDDMHFSKTITFGVYKQGATSMTPAKKTVILIRTAKDPKPTYTMKVTVKPSTVLDKRMAWSSSNTKVARVSKSGVVMGVGRGTAIITVKLANSKVTTSFKVVVK